MSPLISYWTLSQPEIDADKYGLAHITGHIYPSACGRYVYGRTVAWGISAGNLFSSEGILFRYDFDAEEYSRVDGVEYGYTQRYITADNRYIVYWDRSSMDTKRYDTHTGQVTTLENFHSDTYLTAINNYGSVSGTFPIRYIVYRNAVADETVDIPVPNNAVRLYFSSDGKQVCFSYRNCETNYLLRLSDLTEEATVDTVAVLPPNVRVMTIR